MAKPQAPRALRAASLGLGALAAVFGALSMTSAILKARQLHRIAAPLRGAGPEELPSSLRRLLGSEGVIGAAPAPVPAANSSQHHVRIPLPQRSDPKANCLQTGWEAIENAVQGLRRYWR
ncbi:hypothetical protein ABPG75_010563 [Micractinium tetrahymenae]